MWTGIQTPASPIGATAEKLVTRSNDSWSKSSEEVRASNIFLVSDVSFLRHVWFVCGRLWEKSDACSLLFYRNKTRRERFFLPNLRHHNHQRLPSATIRKRKENGARLFTFWHRIKKNYRSGGNVCVCVCEPRDKNKKATKRNAFKLFRAACAYFTFCRLTEARCVEHRSGDGRSWRGAKTARSDKVKRLKYTRELGGSDGKSIKFKNRMRCEDRKMWRRLWLSFTTNFPSTEDIESWAERPLSMAGVITNELRLELYRLYVSRTFIEQARSTRRPVRCTLSYGHDTRRENSNGCECTARPELCVGSDLSRKNVKNFFLTVTGLRQVISTKLGCNAKNILRILAWQQRI